MKKATVPEAPRCFVHVSRPMDYVGEACKVSWAGKKHVTGWRFRCTVQGCRCVETVQLPEPEKPPEKSPQMSKGMKRRLNAYPNCHG